MKRVLLFSALLCILLSRSSAQDLTSATTSYAQQKIVTEDETIVVQGKVLDRSTNAPVKAELDIFFDSDFILDGIQVTNDGSYSRELNRFGWYIITIAAPGYLHKTDTLWILNNKRRVITRDHYLEPIEVGTSVVLHHVYFYFGNTTLKPESFPELDAVVDFFRNNPGIRCEIGGHTDDEGAEDYNLMLSEGRAKAVMVYLVQKGIDAAQVTAKGYGEAKPIDPGITKAAKARNRRVEFVVLEIGH